MKNKPSHESRYADDLSADRVLPATIGGPISPRIVFSHMIAGEVQSGRYSRSTHRKLLKLANELGLRRDDTEDIIARCYQEYAESHPYEPMTNSRLVSNPFPTIRHIIVRAVARIFRGWL